MAARILTRVTTAVAAAVLGLLVGAGVAAAGEDNRELGVGADSVRITGSPDSQIQTFTPPYR